MSQMSGINDRETRQKMPQSHNKFSDLSKKTRGVALEQVLVHRFS